ncbi:MAG: RNB domain-containing ribonuclease [Betaproteobacteria bacterium]
MLHKLAHTAMLQHAMEPDFSPAALAEAGAAKPAPIVQDGQVRDLRNLLWASIDNDDSRDLDQLSVSLPLADGAVKILIAIADVDCLVKKGSAMDAHAAINTTSVYTVAGIFPMLPEKLSTDLTSLNEGQERVAMVVEMTVAADGSITAGNLYRAIVLNRARLAYNAVAAWLEGGAPAPAKVSALPGMEQQLRTQDTAAQALKRARHANGALELETPDVQPLYKDGVLADMLPAKKNRARELIEEFMVASNGVTARFLDQKKLPSLRRVLPVPRRWDRIMALAASVGDVLPAAPDAVALDAFLGRRRQADPQHFPDISLAVVKLLGAGEYALCLPGQTSVGHFGLAVKDYMHTTAPNRRFPDLVAQRLLKSALAGQSSTYSAEELAAIARQCTQQEGNAAKVERQIRKSATAQLMVSRVGSRFSAVVTGASEKGVWVRVSGPTAEGRLVRGFAGLDVGDRVDVELLSTDVVRGFIDFATVGAKS